MKDVSHANPYTGETAGHLFSRGPTVVADGGRADAADDERATDERAETSDGERTETPDDEREESTERMRDVSHTPPNESEDANRVFERGTEPSAERPENDRVAYEE